MSLQQVNLLSASLVPHVEPLTTRQLLAAWGGFAAILVLITGWYGLDVAGLKSDVEKTRAQLTVLRQANEQIRGNALDPVALRAALTELQQRSQEQGQLLALLDPQTGASGFSGPLSGLARARVDGLWLESIRIEHPTGGRTHITLGGRTLDARLVPRFLRRLAEQEDFNGQLFERLDVGADEDRRRVEFTIAGAIEEPS